MPAIIDAKTAIFLCAVQRGHAKPPIPLKTRAKQAPLLRLRNQNSIADAVADLGKPEEIGHLFAGFQRYLYEPATSG